MKKLLAVVALIATSILVSSHSVIADRPDGRKSGPRGSSLADRRPVRVAVLDDLSHLFRAQDASAAGQRDSLNIQKRLLSVIGEKLRSLIKLGDVDQLNAVAADVAAYVLSGGSPDIATDLARREGIDSQMRAVLELSSAFMQGDRDKAGKLMSSVDLEGLPLVLIGRIRLAQAIMSGEDEEVIQTHLALAAATMPGSLVEESALRRSVISHALAHNGSGFWYQVARYQRRFPNSIFAPTFWKDVSDAMILWSATDTAFDIQGIDVVWNSLDRSNRRRLYLYLARRAASENVPKAATFAAARLKRLSTSGSLEEHVGTLYSAIYRIATALDDGARRDLKRIRPDILAPQDQEFLNAALALSNEINRPLEFGTSFDGSPGAEVEPLLTQGEILLNDSKKFLFK